MADNFTDRPVLGEKYQKEIAEIYAQYQEIVKPYVAQLEVMDNEFPVEILNEVRAIIGHIAKCYETTDEEIIQKNIGKAHSHMKRCVLDCYKYLCLTYNDFYQAFIHKYRYTDLTVIDNGEFLPELSRAISDARQKLITAKTKESTVEDVEDAYDEFEVAYTEFHAMYNHIQNAGKNLLRLKRKTIWTWVSSAVLWIIPIIISIVLFVAGL